MIKLLATIGGGIVAAALLGGFYIAIQNTNFRVEKNAADIEGINQFVTILSGRVDDLQKQSQKLGATITTINASDRITDSRSTINTNFSNLNTGTIGVGTTSVASITTLSNLVSIGTITTGVWNGTTLTVSYGGTGSTTLSANQVLLGNGTGNISVVNGLGASGQFLTSGGAGTPPTWTTAAVDQTLNYNFTGTTFNVKNLYASSTSANPIVLNTVSLNTPSTQGGASTTLRNDGSGNLTWAGIYATSTVFTASGTWVRPAYVRTVKVTVVGGGGGGGGASFASFAASGCGGASGGVGIGWVSVTGNVTVTIGAAGAGGVGNNNGAAGGNSSFAGVTTITANGGGGGGVGNDAACSAADAAGGTASGGSINLTGQDGEKAGYFGASIATGGQGADGFYGFGGKRITSANSSNGNAGIGYGSGGGGAYKKEATNATGGAGTAGIVIVEWSEQ